MGPRPRWLSADPAPRPRLGARRAPLPPGASVSSSAQQAARPSEQDGQRRSLSPGSHPSGRGQGAAQVAEIRQRGLRGRSGRPLPGKKCLKRCLSPGGKGQLHSLREESAAEAGAAGAKALGWAGWDCGPGPGGRPSQLVTGLRGLEGPGVELGPLSAVGSAGGRAWSLCS